MTPAARTRNIPVEFNDDWKGVLDPLQRRTLQNRLNQRARRRRLRAAKGDIATKSSAEQSAVTPPAGSAVTKSTLDQPSTPADQRRTGGRSLSTNNSQSPDDTIEPLVRASPTPSTITTTIPTQTHQIEFVELDRFKIIGPSAPAFRRTIQSLESFYHAEFAAGSLRTELLLGLTRLNFLRALHVNIDILGYSAVEMHDDAYSPFGCPGASKISYKPVHELPPALQPTAIQLRVPHHPWLDLIPFPGLRDNLILLGEGLDDAQLCYDMSGRGVPAAVIPGKRLGLAGGETGVIVWRDPWDPSGWEVTESFSHRWGWTLHGCSDVFAAANQWRRVRGEPVLFREREEHPED
ncbi:hypothetical protein BJY01DRAFT_248175 [Aspergillus pseudoustus]|uniref:BZIP domain-containing protein n=1 Tax=Aspergillus pseudoustus TaxID=1810923 RepID=A0ABR4JWX9_9EURO